MRTTLAVLSAAALLTGATAALAVEPPGQAKSEGERAKEYAPGQIKKEEGAQSAREYAPGRTKDTEADVNVGADADADVRAGKKGDADDVRAKADLDANAKTGAKVETE
jgi:hypothetical protein